MFLALSEVKKELEKRATILGVSESGLPTYGYTEHSARPHIEVDEKGYHYVVVERGVELHRFTTLEIDELCFKVFLDITFGMATNYEFKHRIENQDCRRIIFRHQVELLALLSPEWAQRETETHQRILAQHPFDDLAGLRAAICRELREQGFSQEAAEAEAYRQYPLNPAGKAQ